MTAPHPARCLRQIDRKHVDSLKAAFRKRPENNIIFFGNILKDDFDIRLLGTSGYVNVETIGGNHSRVALQELLEEGINMSPTVYMTIYKGLCDTEALKLGFDHNVGHELGRPTSPEELMLLFRRELLKLIDEEELNNPQNSSMKTWKQTCADILGITKTKLHNVYHCMLSIATASASCWDRIIDFIFLWKEEKIRRKPKGDIKKTHFTKMSEVSEEMRITLLTELNDGDIDWVQFNSKCSQEAKK